MRRIELICDIALWNVKERKSTETNTNVPINTIEWHTFEQKRTMELVTGSHNITHHAQDSSLFSIAVDLATAFVVFVCVRFTEVSFRTPSIWFIRNSWRSSPFDSFLISVKCSQCIEWKVNFSLKLRFNKWNFFGKTKTSNLKLLEENGLLFIYINRKHIRLMTFVALKFQHLCFWWFPAGMRLLCWMVMLVAGL